ncbi:hypothetical protein V1281_006129 [Nitrobacteraceae bacterium AZCC 2161]
MVDRDLPVRHILASVTVPVIIPTDAPLAPIEIEIPLWKLRRVTHDGGGVALRSLLPARPLSGQVELGGDKVIAAKVIAANVQFGAGDFGSVRKGDVVADYRVLVDQYTRLRNQMMATERSARAMSRASGQSGIAPNAFSRRSYSRPR